MSERFWFYESEGNRLGPVTEKHLAELFDLGAVRRETLVWSEGMSDWQDYATVMPTFEGAGSVEPMDEEMETCAFSGKRLPISQMLPFGEQWIAPEHREDFIQRLEEGGGEVAVPLPGYPFAPRLTLASLISTAWEIWSAQWGLLVLFAGAINAPFLLAVVFLAGSGPERVNPIGQLSSQLVNLIAGAFVGAGLFAYALDRWKGGGAWDVPRLFREAKHHFGKVLYTRILVSIIVFPGAFLMGFIAVASGSFPVVLVVLILAGSLLTYVGNRLMTAEAFSLVIGRGGGAATRRSWERTRGRFWQLFLYRLVLYSPVVMVSGALGALAALPPLNHPFSNVAAAVLGVCLGTPCIVFEIVVALHLEANPPVSADLEGPESSKEESPQHDLVA